MGVVKDNLILFIIIITSYFLYYIYSFINNTSHDSEIYEIDLLSSGISSFMTGLLLVGLDESAKTFNPLNLDFGDPTTKVAFFLFVYAIFLIFFAFVKILPRFLVVIFGNSELDMFINIVAILLITPKVVIDGTMLAVIGAPLFVLLIIQRIRRLMG